MLIAPTHQQHRTCCLSFLRCLVTAKLAWISNPLCALGWDVEDVPNNFKFNVLCKQQQKAYTHSTKLSKARRCCYINLDEYMP